MIKKYLLYLVRWQLSTPILAVCIWWLVGTVGAAIATVVANLIGGLVFFWIDRWIFRHTPLMLGELWETRTNIICTDCGRPADKGYRLVKAAHYDKTGDKRPEFRCHECSRKKYQQDRSDLGAAKPATSS